MEKAPYRAIWLTQEKTESTEIEDSSIAVIDTTRSHGLGHFGKRRKEASDKEGLGTEATGDSPCIERVGCSLPPQLLEGVGSTEEKMRSVIVDLWDVVTSQRQVSSVPSVFSPSINEVSPRPEAYRFLIPPRAMFTAISKVPTSCSPVFTSLRPRYNITCD
jgi:hypothetical protein